MSASSVVQLSLCKSSSDAEFMVPIYFEVCGVLHVILFSWFSLIHCCYLSLLLSPEFAGHCTPVLRVLVAKILWGELIQKFFESIEG